MNVKSKEARLARLLKLIPFLQKNSGVSLVETANFFGISEKELLADLNLIWLCGLPGYSHLELIDVSYDSGFISISNAETLERPMRMTFEEGAALLLAVTKLSEVTPIGDSGTLMALRNKITDLLALDISERIPTQNQRPGSLDLPMIRNAIASKGQLLEIEYYSATLDQYLQLRIKPIEISSMNGYLYLLGQSLSDERHRYFRMDRIQRVERVEGEVFANTGEKSFETTAIANVEVGEEGWWFIQKWGLHALKRHSTRKLFTGELVVYDSRWLERAVLTAAGSLRVLGPEPLRAQIGEAAARTLENYREPLK